MEDESHPCEHDECSTSVHFDDEPFCFKHSPDEGSYSPIYSYKASKKTFEDDMNVPLFPKF